MRFKFFLLPVFFLVVFSFSCAKKVDYKINPKNSPTIRNKIVFLDKNTDWTEPIDKDLETPESEKDKEDRNKNFFFPHHPFPEPEPESTVPAGLTEVVGQDRLFYQKNAPLDEEIYPEIPDFASLDITQIDERVLNTISKFVAGMNKNKVDESTLSGKSKFLIPVFNSDFKKIENVDSYLVGKPYVIQNEFMDEYQIPIRFKTKSYTLDAILFLVYTSDGYFVEQIHYGRKI